MPRRYSTEIRGDGATRTWTLPHSLRDSKPAVMMRDAANRDVSGIVRCTWPSAYEVAITFAQPPPVGMLYQVDVVANPSAPSMLAASITDRDSTDQPIPR